MNERIKELAEQADVKVVIGTSSKVRKVRRVDCKRD
jgi:NAD-dependent SIR2 family protein deacetylase